MDRIQQRKITRSREFRACTSCRKSKLKCDRQLPCSACTRRNESDSCFYEKRFGERQNEHSRRLRAEAKLEHLEQLVQQLSHSQQTSATPDNGNMQPHECGVDQLFKEPVHHGATHWSAMLEDIEELRSTINSRDDIELGETDFNGNEDDGISILFSTSSSISLEQLFTQYLPPKNEADRLVATYFRAKAVAAPFIHSKHFSRNYRLFWETPRTTSPLWTSILFSILDITTRTVSTSTSSNAGDNKINRFATASAYCLAIGQYHKPQNFAVEALLLYAQARCITSVDISPELAIMFGTLVRLATAMGYHRDAGGRLDLSPFEAEMRRRTWSLCMQLDLLVSFQLGLPSNVQFPTWDTQPPTNIRDSDFDEDTIQLPLARPAFEPTEIVFYIAKHKLMVVFEKIIRHTLSPPGQSNYELNLIDAELHATYQYLPAVFHAQLIADSIVDTPSLIVTRLCVNAIYQKCVCVLHRKYVTEGRPESIQRCYSAAMDLVQRFVDAYGEFEPGGQLETERWFRGSITWHDFLLGCTALCLTVCSARGHIKDGSSIGIVDALASLELLRSADNVIEQHTMTSKDSRKVRRLINNIFLKFENQANAPSDKMEASVRTGQDPVSREILLATRMPSSGEDIDWEWEDTPLMPVDDPAWTYMKQFLELPDEDISDHT